MRYEYAFLRAWVAGLLFLGPATVALSAQEMGDPDKVFRAEVWPLLQKHCLECHGSDKQKGELRLDSAAAVVAGGHTGNKLIGDTPDSSEIFLRLTSDDPNYRMPLDRPPLTPAEIDAVRRWILIGGRWATEPIPPLDSPEGYGWLMRVEPFLARFERWFSLVRPIAVPLAGLLIAIALIERAKRWNHQRDSKHRAAESNDNETEGSAAPGGSTWGKLRREWYLVAALLLALVAFYVHHEDEAAAHGRTLAGLREAIAKTAAQDSSPIQRGPFGGPIPPRPKHVKQLGGTYFRGNDERDPRLYNGGFYRTATLRVSLRGADKQILQWGDSVGAGELYLTLEIERARQATPALFTDAIMRTIFLSHQVALVNRPEAADQPVYFEVVEPNEKWIAHYPIRATGGLTELSGMLYVYKGQETDGQVDAKFHYGISYDVRLVDGNISRDSEIWMGSLSVPAGMIIPPHDRMILNEWFDFRPLPEIEGDNSQDPALLGIPEYLEDKRAPGEPR